MTKFLKDILKILAIFFVMGTLCFKLSTEANKRILNSKLFIFNSDVHGLIIGDSHTMTSLNPGMLPSFVNFSQMVESYFYTYYKLKHLLEKNPQIKTVVLGYSYHNLVISQDRSIIDPTYTNRAFDTYYCMLDKEAKSVIWQVNKKFISDYLRYEFGVPFGFYKNNIAVRIRALFGKTFTDADRSFFGGYYRGSGTVLNDHETDDYVLSIYYPGNDKSGIKESAISVKYLHKILVMCTEKKIQVILYNAPLHPHLLKRIPNEAKTLFAALTKEISAHHPAVEYLDLSSMKLTDSMFGDSNHVNGAGADIVTKEFSSLLKISNVNEALAKRKGKAGIAE